MTIVKNKTVTQHFKMVNVMERWMGMGNRKIFEAWRDHVVATMLNLQKISQRKDRLRHLKIENRNTQQVHFQNPNCFS